METPHLSETQFHSLELESPSRTWDLLWRSHRAPGVPGVPESIPAHGWSTLGGSGSFGDLFVIKRNLKFGKKEGPSGSIVNVHYAQMLARMFSFALLESVESYWTSEYRKI